MIHSCSARNRLWASWLLCEGRYGMFVGMGTSRERIQPSTAIPTAFSELTGRDIVGMIAGALLGYLTLMFW